jgi:hypothetical protein
MNACPDTNPRQQRLLHLIEDGAYDSSDDAALDIFSSIFLRHVFREGVGKSGDGERLQPDSSGASESGEEDTVAAEDHVFDAGDGGDLERDAGLEGSDVAGVDAESFSGLKVADDKFAGEFEPGHALSSDALEQEAVATENSCAERLLEADAELNLRGGAEKPMAVDHEFVSGRNFDRNDVAGELGGKGQFAGRSHGAVFGHEDGAAAGDALEHAEKASAAAELRVRGHLNGTGHPGEFSGFGDDGVVSFEDELEHGHGGAGDAALHENLPNENRCMNGSAAALACSSRVYICRIKGGAAVARGALARGLRTGVRVSSIQKIICTHRWPCVEFVSLWDNL